MKRLVSLCLCAYIASLTSCVKEMNLYQPDLEPSSSYFDFSTTHKVSFDVDYGNLAAGALLQIFTTNPLVANDDNTTSISGVAAYSIFTDEKGCFKDEIELPTSADKVYLVMNSMVAPQCVEVAVSGCAVSFKSNMINGATRAADSRVASNLQAFPLDESKNIYMLVKTTNKYGAIDDVNNLYSTGEMNAALITAIQRKLWNSTDKPNTLDNSSLLRGTKYVNTVIAEAYEKADGTKVLVEDADVYFTFVTEAGWNQNTLGYYYYKTDEVPSSPDKVKKFVIIPNASIDGNVPYLDTPPNKNAAAYGYGNAPLKPNTRVQLLFEDANGNLTTKFPAGYTIGYFMIQKGFTADGKINTNGTFFYSNAEWNPMFKNHTERFISVATTDGTVVYGAEDGEDKSYEDVLFTIDANPNEAIQNPERPVIDPSTVEVLATETTTTTYAYEDIWPTGGDYDLNDVIVEHTRSITFNQNNYVREVVDEFKSVHLEDAATYKSAFAIQMDKNQRGTISCSDGIEEESKTQSFFIFKNCIDERDQVRSITRAFDNNALKKGNLKVSDSEMNPYIVVHFGSTGWGNRTEVHLPKMSATSLANQSQIGSESDAYYVDKGGKYPFAIAIPGTFTPVTEKTNIGTEYKYFDAWVSSNGAEHTDWYNYYQK